MSDTIGAYEEFAKIHRRVTELEAKNKRLRDALQAAEESIVCFMGVHNYPMESGAGIILEQVRDALKDAGHE
jgi:hypothetical protein